MSAPNSPHPTDQTLYAYAMGKLDDASAESVNSHLEGCTDCRRRTSEVTSDSFLNRFQGGQSAIGRTAPPRSPAGPAAPTPVGTLPPELADHKDYEVVRELGRGGMGVVYLVSNRLMGRNEVLKVMGRHLVERPEVSERFLREIRAVASLRHPNIVAAHHAFHVGESIAFTMEYVEGYDLAKMVKGRGPLPVAHACLFAHQAAQGLQHAHEEGMVHRDIKPGNLMVSRRGDKAVIKVLDFGLAKAAREGQFDGALTHAGQMLGTPDFIAPEQCVDAQSADIRADIYSLGCTLYYLLTGGPPFRATSLYDLLQAHHSMDARLLNFVRPEVPSELAALVAKMMAKEPERRFRTPAEVSAALAPFYKKGGVAPNSARPDVSQDATPAARRPVPSVKRSPTEGTSSSAPTPESGKPAKAPRPEAMWASLIDVREPEPLAEKTIPRPAPSGPTRKPPWRSRPAITSAALFGAFTLGIIIYISIDKNGFKAVVRSDKAASAGGVVKPNGDLAKAVEASSSQVESKWDRPILAKLAKLIPMHFPAETPLEEILEHVKKSTGGANDPSIPIYVDALGLQDVEKTIQSPATIDVQDIPLKDSLRLILQQLGLTYHVTKGLLLISSPKVIEEKRGKLTRIQVAPDDNSTGTKGILAWLDEPIPMEFPQETTLEEALKYVKDAAKGPNRPGIQLYVDPVGLQECEKTLQSPVTIDLKGVPLNGTLTLILDQLGLEYCIKNGLMFISSPAGVKRELAIPPAEPGKNADQVDEGQFLPLFNGRDRSGWKLVGNTNHSWQVFDGILMGTGTPTVSFLVTERTDFADFHLRVETMMSEGPNSGIVFRMEEGGAKYHAHIAGSSQDEGNAHRNTGCLCVTDQFGVPLTDLAQADPVVPIMPGEWFTEEVIAEGGRITVKVKGQTVVRYKTPDRRLLSGAIGLQCRGNSKVAFRKIAIKELKGIAKPSEFSRSAVGGTGGSPTSASKLPPALVGEPPVPPARFEIVGGRWRRDGLELVQDDVSARNPVLLFGDDRWTDYDFSADVMRIGGNDMVSILFRRTETGHYSFDIQGNGLMDCSLCFHNPKFANLRRTGIKLELTRNRWYSTRVRSRGMHLECTVRDGDQEVAHLEIKAHVGQMVADLTPRMAQMNPDVARLTL